MAEDSPELRELKKQTRVMAEKEASYGAGSGLLLGIGLMIFLAWPSPWLANLLGLYGNIAILVGCMVLGYVAAYKDVMRD